MIIGVVDYDAGNLTSVRSALNYLGVKYNITSDPEVLKKSDKIIFPGVGEASAAMKRLIENGIDQSLIELFKKGTPILGICLGCQIILDYSEEGETAGLGLIPGYAGRFNNNMGLKIPHMGWNQVDYNETSLLAKRLFNGIPSNSSFYFVHSYYPVPKNNNMCISTTEYGINFSSAIAHNNVVAVQFHPEKSGVHGLQLLQNYIDSEID